MTITIREALRLPDMVQSKLVAGEGGVDNHIRWVTIVEIVEDATRLQEGEFLITTGFGLETSPEKQAQFIPSLAKQGLSGVAIHTGFYLREIPAAFIEAANQCNLPLIEIPTELNFSTITKAILTPIMNRQFEILSYSQAIHDQMIQVALTGKGLTAIAKELATLTQGNVRITDSLGFELVSFFTDIEIANEGKDSMIRSVPIQAAHEAYGTITLSKQASDWKYLDQVALQHASTLCALEIVKDRAIAETEWRMQGDFVEEILSGRTEWSSEVEARSRTLGYPLSGGHLIIQLSIHGLQNHVEITSAHQKLTMLIKRQAHRTQVTYLLKERSQLLLLIVPNVANSFSFVEQISLHWTKIEKENPLHIGISNVVTSLPLFKQAANEAHFATLVFPLLKKSPATLHFKDMAGYQFLFSFYRDQSTLRQLWEPFLTEIIRYDQKHGQNLLKTIDVYLQTNLNGLKAAQLLYIHRHTLKYRLQQIVLKTGLDLDTAAHRWQLQLAIMAYRLHELLYPL